MAFIIYVCIHYWNLCMYVGEMLLSAGVSANDPSQNATVTAPYVTLCKNINCDGMCMYVCMYAVYVCIYVIWNDTLFKIDLVKCIKEAIELSKTTKVRLTSYIHYIWKTFWTFLLSFYKEDLDGSFDGAVNLTALSIAEDSGAGSSATGGITDDATHSSSGDINATNKQRLVAKSRTSTGRTRGSISVSVDEIDGNLLHAKWIYMYVSIYVYVCMHVFILLISFMYVYICMYVCIL